ncbi:MAG: cupin domain-containing protein [Thermoguttaceae bacterium]|nr:cupin domain-containing protein [Thermoguttaceae bacterium]
MKKSYFPDIIGQIPPVDYGIEGLEVHRSHTGEGTVYFVAAYQNVSFPEHSHAEQWSVVLDGEAHCRMNGKTFVYRKGDTYVIPAGVKHQITLLKGYAEADYVADPNDGE